MNKAELIEVIAKEAKLSKAAAHACRAPCWPAWAEKACRSQGRRWASVRPMLLHSSGWQLERDDHGVGTRGWLCAAMLR